jgi:ring-1,2-phenylacetyl-CoA epoxidase subunit PaaD
MVTTMPSIPEIMAWLAEVPDPEIPVLSVLDLGIIREVRIEEGSQGPEVVVAVTPTYSGCPATRVIAHDIRQALLAHGVANCRLETRLSPPWTTDWMSASGRELLRDYGIAPPGEKSCPRCHATSVKLVSQHGSTPCKALYVCNLCQEPFDAFKCH